MNIQRGILIIDEVEKLEKEKYINVFRDSVTGNRKIRIFLIF
jgi:hypothetical protein